MVGIVDWLCPFSEMNRAEVAKYAKNYLPRLLQIYTTDAHTDGSNQRLAALETVKIYLKISPQDTIDELFDKVRLERRHFPITILLFFDVEKDY